MKRVIERVAIKPSSGQVQQADDSFSQAVIDWQQEHGRHSLPWQKTDDAYRVWLSEIMLQQTQVTAVIPYYQRFLARFPDVQSLALAPSEEVMALWSGLGYYTRARNLHQCAKQVVEKYQGKFPSEPDLLKELPGIGRSTAAAIAAFSYGTVAAILDGNVKRVFARVFGISGFPGTKVIEDAMWLKAQALLPSENIGSYTQGLMDLGATLCTRSSPQCSICPMQARCIAHAQGRTAELPTRKPKKILKEKQVLMLIMLDEGRVLLEQRPNSGIWGGLLSLPEFDGMREINSVLGDRPVSTQLIKSNAENRHHEIVRYVSRFGDAGELSYLSPFTHVFTHFKLHIQPVLVPLFQRDLAVGEETYTWLNLSDVENAALPAPVKALLLTL